MYNRIGRASPDVAANGAGWEVYIQGKLRSVGGTSMAAPVFASLLSLVSHPLRALAFFVFYAEV